MSSVMDDLAEMAVRPRAEVEVAADAVWACFAAGLVAKTPQNVAVACRAAHVPAGELRRAEARRRSDTYRPPAPRDATLEDDPHTAGVVPIRPSVVPRPAPPSPSPPTPRSARERAKQPTDGYRMCNGPLHGEDGALLGTSDFAVRNQATGARDGVCRACRAQLARDRHAKVTRLAAIGAAHVQFILTHDADVACDRCNGALRAGQEVAGTTQLAHVACPS